jgi:hypothetical protein
MAIEGKEELDELFKASESNLNSKILKISSAVKRALAINDMNISELALVSPSIHHGFLNVQFSEQNILEQLEAKKEKLEEEYFEKFGKSNRPRYESKALIDAQEDVKKLNSIIKEQKKVVSYITDIVKIMANYNFSIKNAVEILKIS